MPPFPQQEAEAAVAASFGRPIGAVFASFGPPVAAASIAQVHRAEVATPTGTRAVAVKVLRPGIEQRFHADLRAFTFAARHAENLSAEARRLRLIEVVDTLRRSRDGRDGLPPGGRRALGNGGEHQGRSGFPRAGGRLGPHQQGSADARMDRRNAAVGSRAPARPKASTCAEACPCADPDVSAPCAARRLLSRRHASGKSVRRRRRPARSRSTSASWAGSASKERLFLAEILHGFITRDYHRVAEVHFEAGYVPPTIRSKASRRRSAPSASRSTAAPPRKSPWRGCSRCCSR